jgi:hypothetical protein
MGLEKEIVHQNEQRRSERGNLLFEVIPLIHVFDTSIFYN